MALFSTSRRVSSLQLSSGHDALDKLYQSYALKTPCNVFENNHKLEAKVSIMFTDVRIDVV